MVEQMSELVKETECDASTDTGDAQVDRVPQAKAVGARLRDRRSRPNGNRFKVRQQTVQTRSRSKRAIELRHKRAATR